MHPMEHDLLINLIENADFVFTSGRISRIFTGGSCFYTKLSDCSTRYNSDPAFWRQRVDAFSCSIIDVDRRRASIKHLYRDLEIKGTCYTNRYFLSWMFEWGCRQNFEGWWQHFIRNDSVSVASMRSSRFQTKKFSSLNQWRWAEYRISIKSMNRANNNSFLLAKWFRSNIVSFSGTLKGS